MDLADDILQSASTPPPTTVQGPNLADDLLQAAQGDEQYDRYQRVGAIQAELGRARSEASREGEGWGEYVATRALPFTSPILRASMANAAGEAARRISAGTPRQGDFDTVAHHETLQRIEEQRGVGATIGSQLMGAAAPVGEMTALNPALKLIGKGVMAGAEAIGLAPRIAQALGFAGRTAVTPLVAPSMGLPEGAVARAQARAEPSSPLEARNLAPAYGMAALNSAIMGSLGQQAQRLIPAEGAVGVVARLLASPAIGMTEMRAVELAGGLTGLQTGYGTLGDLFTAGRRGQAGKQLAGEFFTFLAIGGMGELQRRPAVAPEQRGLPGPQEPAGGLPEPPTPGAPGAAPEPQQPSPFMAEGAAALQELLTRLRGQRMSSDAAANVLRDIRAQFDEAILKQKDITSQEFLNRFQPGPIRDFVRKFGDMLRRQAAPEPPQQPRPQAPRQPETPVPDAEIIERQGLTNVPEPRVPVEGEILPDQPGVSVSIRPPRTALEGPGMRRIGQLAEEPVQGPPEASQGQNAALDAVFQRGRSGGRINLQEVADAAGWTDREWDVANALATGASLRDIGHDFDLSHQTIANIGKSIAKKLQMPEGQWKEVLTALQSPLRPVENVATAQVEEKGLAGREGMRFTPEQLAGEKEAVARGLAPRSTIERLQGEIEALTDEFMKGDKNDRISADLRRRLDAASAALEEAHRAQDAQERAHEKAQRLSKARAPGKTGALRGGVPPAGTAPAGKRGARVQRGQTSQGPAEVRGAGTQANEPASPPAPAIPAASGGILKQETIQPTFGQLMSMKGEPLLKSMSTGPAESLYKPNEKSLSPGIHDALRKYVETGNGWGLEVFKEALNKSFDDPSVIKAALKATGADKLKAGKAPASSKGMMNPMAGVRANELSHAMDFIFGEIVKEARNELRQQNPEATKAEIESALQSAGAAESGHVGDVGSFDPAEFESGGGAGGGVIDKIMSNIASFMGDQEGALKYTEPRISKDEIVRFAGKFVDSIARYSGEMLPEVSRVSPRSAEAIVKWNAAAYDYAPRLVDHILENTLLKVMGKKRSALGQFFLGPKVTDADAIKAGGLFVERSLRYTRAAFDNAMRKATNANDYFRFRDLRDNVTSIIGQPDSPFKTLQDYHDFRLSPEGQALLKADVNEAVPWRDAFYKKYKDMDPDEVINSLTQIPGHPFNLVPINDKSKIGPGVVPTRGSLKNLKAKRLRFSLERHGDSDAYQLDYREIIRNTITHSATNALKAEALRTMHQEGTGVWDVPGQQHLFGERPGVEFVNIAPPRGTQAAAPNQTSFYVHPDVATAFRKALDIDPVEGWTKVPLAFSKIPVMEALAGMGEFAAHGKNLAGAVLVPGVSLGDIARNLWHVIEGNPKAKAELLKLAEIQATKHGGMESGTIVEGMRYLGERFLGKSLPEGFKFADPTFYTGKVLKGLDEVMRLTLSHAHDALVKAGKETSGDLAKANFINKNLGQYNKKMQNGLVRLLRDSGVNPFATATSIMGMRAVRSLFGGYGGKPTTWRASVELRARMYAKMAAVLSSVFLANFLKWGRWDGDDDTPFGAYKTGTDADGYTTYWHTPLSLPLRALRATGMLALIEGKRKGDPGGKIVDKMIDDAWFANTQVLRGPLVSFLETLRTGKDVFGHEVIKKEPGEEGHTLRHLEAAVIHSNQPLSSLMGVNRQGFLGPLGAGTRRKH